MFGNGTSLRHLPFFEEIAAHEEHQAEWRAATAGLVTLRLVDAWIEEGSDIAARNSRSVAAVLEAIDKMDEGSTIPGILRSIVAAMQEARPGDTREVMPKILAYGRALEYDAHWLLALDAYGSVIHHAHPCEESETAIVAHQRRGVSLRTIGRFDQALEAYAASSAVAENVGDMIGVLRAKVGAAIVVMERGNLPEADRALEEAATQAARLGFPEQQAAALGSRAAIAGYRNEYETAIRFAYDALNLSPEPADRDRVLNNIGTAFHLLGIRSAARDAFLVLSVTAQEQYTRWAAMLSLMTLAAEDGSEPAFQQLRGSIAVGALPPDIKVDYFIHLGRAERALNHEDLAEIAFAKAVELAERYGLSRHLFEAERELASRKIHGRVPPSKSAVGPLAEVASSLRELRSHSAVGAV